MKIRIKQQDEIYADLHNLIINKRNNIQQEDKMKKIVELLAKEFNSRNVTWAIGGSFLLKRYGIDNGLGDLDIMVSMDSIEEASEIMNNIAENLEVINNDHYQTERFESYQLENHIINIIGNLKCNFNESFTYIFDKTDINSIDISSNEKIYFSHLLDWYVIYQEINNKETSSLIEQYYGSGAFLDNKRFESKFGMINIPNVKDSLSSFKKRIYHLG